MKVVDSLKFPRFAGIRTFMRLPQAALPEKNDVAIIGVPFDCGTSIRPGTRYAPAALREISLTYKPYCPVLNTNIFENLSVADYGDILTIPGYIEDTMDSIRDSLIPHFKNNIIPIVMGGDHSITLGELRAAHAVHGPVALLQFDAHSDSVPEFFGKPYNHGTQIYHAIQEGLILPKKSIQIGIRGCLYSKHILNYPKEQGLRIVLGEELHAVGCDAVIQEALERIGDTPTFVTFDIDFLDAAYAPGAGSPEVEGFSTRQALYMMREICKNINTIGMDLVEVLPDRDPSQITANAGVAMMYAFLAALSYKCEQKNTSADAEQ